MPKYISIAMNGLARLTPNTPTDIEGLGTHNLKTCVAVFIFNNKRMSLLHIAALTDLTSLTTEAKEVGDNSQIILVYNSTECVKASDWLEANDATTNSDVVRTKAIDFLKTHFAKTPLQIFDSSTGDAYLDRKGHLALDSSQLGNVEIEFSPQTDLRYAIQHLNMTLLLKKRNITLEFDGQQFCQIDSLCEEGKTIVGSIRPYLRQKKLKENEAGIAEYFEKEVLSKINSNTQKINATYLKNTILYSLKIILENSISRQYYDNRPCFFTSGDNIKVMLSPMDEDYARRLAFSQMDEDINEEKESKTLPKLINNPHKKSTIPFYDATNKLLALPIFWLNSLPDSTIDGIAQELSMDKKNFKKPFG